MECDKFRNNILDFYYSDCDPDTIKEMWEHKTTCPECAALVQRISQVLGSADFIKEIEPDSFYYTRLSSKIKDKKPENIYARLFARLAQPLVAACLCALGIFIGVKISGNLPDTTINTKNNQNEVAELQLADDYFPKSGNEELIETYYLNDK
jgi:hypothetical protein